MKNRKIDKIFKWLYFILFFEIFILCLFYYFENDKKQGVVVFGETRFKIEIAKTFKERYLGLSFRDEICEKCGMLFVMPEKNKYYFSMRGMRFDLDFVWIEDGKVVKIDRNVPSDFTGDIFCEKLVDWVLEIPSGSADKFNLQKGDKITLN